MSSFLPLVFNPFLQLLCRNMRHSWKLALQAPNDKTKEHLQYLFASLQLNLNHSDLLILGIKAIFIHELHYLNVVVTKMPPTILNLKQLCLPVTHSPTAAIQKLGERHLWYLQTNFKIMSL